MINSSVSLDVDTIPDELYNQLLMAFVSKAVELGIDVPKGSNVVNWTLRAEIAKPGKMVQ